MLEKTDEKVAEIISQLQKYTPEAYEVLVHGMFVKGLTSLFFVIFSLSVALIVIKICFKVYRWYSKNEFERQDPFISTMIVSFLILMLCFFCFFGNIYEGIFYTFAPKAALIFNLLNRM